jgi:hypothetical protein
LKKATKLSLTGAQWQHILELFAKSDDNKTAKIKDIGSLLWPNLPRSRPQKIKNAMSELGRTLRRHVKVTMNKTPAFERAGDVYVASFHIATLLSDEANVYHFGQCKH